MKLYKKDFKIKLTFENPYTYMFQPNEILRNHTILDYFNTKMTYLLGYRTLLNFAHAFLQHVCFIVIQI